MNDRYLFRGFHPGENGTEKVFVNGEWVKGVWIEGYCARHCTMLACFSQDAQPDKHLIIHDGSCDWGFEPPIKAVEVIPETVGQYTGLTDRNGNKIFEGDIVTCIAYKCFGCIGWDQIEAGFYFAIFCDGFIAEEESMYDYVDEMEIIGSIHSIPDIMERKEK